ncbi:TRAP transporter small permease [Hominifimenecus sp. rT4P-3]|uniref:TRAP transporter small permease n=1 Tax=Hominifimenecus sp. rT4P-3 TaxID=3242979 RepID=UPI003DA55404
MKVLRWLDDNLEKCLLLVFLIVMVIALTLQIIFRFVLNTPLSWSEELARYMFVWSGFISISYCLKTNIAIRIDQVVNFLPKKGQLIMNLVVYILLLAYFIHMTPYAYEFFERAASANQTMPALQAPIALVYVSPFLGFILAMIRLVQNFVKDVLALVKGTGKEEEGK